MLAFIHRALELDAPLALDNSLAIDLDVLTTPLPEHDRLLERVVPGILLPVLNVIRKLISCLVYATPDREGNSYPNLAIQVNMNVIEPCQVQGLSNNKRLSLR